jgi:putative hemolysin
MPAIVSLGAYELSAASEGARMGSKASSYCKGQSGGLLSNLRDQQAAGVGECRAPT